MTGMNTLSNRSAFVVDRMLGGLAKWLRVAGFDALYSRSYKREDLINISRQTKRIIITRDTWFESHGDKYAVVLHDNYTIGQLKELFKKLNIIPEPKRFFTRCIVCNSQLITVSKDEVKDVVPAYVLSTQDVFSKCPFCNKVYWGGTHRENMLQTLKVILQ